MDARGLFTQVPEVTLRRVYRKWYVIDHAQVVYSGALAGAMALMRAVLEVEQ